MVFNINRFRLNLEVPNSSQMNLQEAEQASQPVCRFREIAYFYGQQLKEKCAILSSVPQIPRGDCVHFKAPYRLHPKAVTLKGNVYIIGGKDKEHKIVAQVDRMDLSTGSISTASPMSCPRWLAGVTVNVDCILVFGGCLEREVLSSCEEYDSFTDSWSKLPDMPTARQACGAIHIPTLGELVLGGWVRGTKLSTAELLRAVNMGNAGVRTWEKIAPMNTPRYFPSAVYFNRSIFVVSIDDRSIEVLSLPNNYPEQWTLLSGCTTPSDRPFSMCVFNGRILLADDPEDKSDDEVFLLKMSPANNVSETQFVWEHVCQLPGVEYVQLLVERNVDD